MIKGVIQLSCQGCHQRDYVWEAKNMNSDSEWMLN